MKQVLNTGRLVLLGGLLFLASCTKENKETPESAPSITEAHKARLAAKVNAWLAERKTALPSGQKTIDALTENLLTQDLRLESYKKGDRLIVVPVAAGYRSANNTDKSPLNYLVVVLTGETITEGSIIQYISANGQKPAPENSFSKIFTYQKLDCDGQFSILDLADELVLELKFKNGSLNSVAEKRSKRSGNAQARTNTCTDWYVITTYYDMDGNVLSVTEDYLFSTGCHEGEGGGPNGSGGANISYEYDTERLQTWTVHTTADGRNIVTSTEKLMGKRNGDNSVFSNIVHDGSDVWNIVENGPGDQHYATWHPDPWSKTIAPDKKTGTCSIKGTLTYAYKPEYDVPLATKTWRAKTDL